MHTLYFTIAAIVLYFVSDRLLDLLERRAGRRFENRSLIFFAMLLGLSLATFALIRAVIGTS
jgi:predicted PurR-regulated permease PerM